MRVGGSMVRRAGLMSPENWSPEIGRWSQRGGSGTSEDLRRYQLHLTDRAVSRIRLDAVVIALRFFFEITLRRGELMAAMSHLRVARTLPLVLSLEEVVGLRVDDIDRQPMAIRVDQGEGRKDHYVMLSPSPLALLRAWWRAGRCCRWSTTMWCYPHLHCIVLPPQRSIQIPIAPRPRWRHPHWPAVPPSRPSPTVV